MRDFLPAPSRQFASAASGARATRFADEPRRTMSAPGRRSCASPARDVEHSAYATASRPHLSAGPHPTALQLHAATAHTDRRRMCSCRTQKLPRTDPPMQCIGLKLTGASTAPAPYAVLCGTCVACKSGAVHTTTTHTTHLARAVVFPTFPFGCAVRSTSACAVVKRSD